MLQSLHKSSLSDEAITDTAQASTAGFLSRILNVVGLISYLRPAILCLGALALPFVSRESQSLALMLLACLIGLFGYDLLQAYRQWLEIFVEGLQGGVEIGQDEIRPQGFSTSALGGPRSVVMRRLPFWRWVGYKYSLRQDYVFKSTWRWLRHHVRSFFLKRGYGRARTWHPAYQVFWGRPERELAELVLETSLGLGVTSIHSDGRGRRIATFCYDNWLCPAGVETPGELLKVKRLKLDICLKQRKAIACELDGVQIGTGSDALCYLYLALSGYHHTALHAYANWAAIPNHEDAHLNRAATWTLATNAVALFTGRAFQQNPDTMKEALRYNCRRGIPKHGSGALLRELARHSRYTLFVYRARGALIKTIEDHSLKVDAESLFLSTVVHSLDHYMATLSVDPYDLIMTGSKHRAAQMVRLIFTEPLEPGLVNTRISAVKSGWPKTLYERLSLIDETLARQIDVGVAY